MVRKALDASFESICRNHGLTKKEAFQTINKHLDTMSAEWFSGKAPNIAYDDPLLRFGYLYCHTAVNANLCDFAIRETPELEQFIDDKLNNEQALRVCAFGGGPGTELLALTKHIIRSGRQSPPAHIEFQLIDRVNEWADTWTALQIQIELRLKKKFKNIADRPFMISKTFCPFDMTNVGSWGNMAQIFEHDLYIMNYVVSEITGSHKGFQKTVGCMADAAPAGAMFLFIDRRQTSVLADVKTLMTKAKLSVRDMRGTRRNCDVDEQASDLGPYIKNIGRHPRVQWGNSFWQLGVKE